MGAKAVNRSGNSRSRALLARASFARTPERRRTTIQRRPPRRCRRYWAGKVSNCSRDRAIQVPCLPPAEDFSENPLSLRNARPRPNGSSDPIQRHTTRPRPRPAPLRRRLHLDDARHSARTPSLRR
jgi:hypothetical protein